MTNNKQQTAVEWFSNQAHELFEQYSEGNFDRITLNKLMLQATAKAKEMEKEMTIKLYADYENYLEEAFKNQCGGQAVILSFQEFYEQRYGGSEQ
jgi:hypothetical protein